MSSADLTVGPLATELQDAAVLAIKRMRVGDTGHWRDFSGPPTHISLLNLASLVFFLDYAARLEGLPNAAAVKQPKLRNIPWWCQINIWLPLEFRPPGAPALEMDGEPILLGSVQGLLADLAEIQKRSDLDLGTIPDGYLTMRSDYRAFMRSGFCLKDDRSLVQWIWLGLHDGAQLALRGAPLILNAV